MSPLHELSAAVRTRRSDIGLTQTMLARLSGLSRATVNQVENGTIKDLSISRATRLLEVLGLSVTISASRPKVTESSSRSDRSLEIAARTASVSYKELLTTKILREALLTGNLQKKFVPHLNALLDEAPVSLLAAVVERLHREEGMERAQLWNQMREFAQRFKSARDLWR